MPEFRDVDQGANSWKERAEKAYEEGNYDQAQAAAAIAHVYVIQSSSIRTR